MAEDLEISAAQAVALLSSRTDEAYELVGRLTGGETGAYEVLGPTGRRLVVKWAPVSPSSQSRLEGVGLSERLRTAAGWPVPEQRTIIGDDFFFVLQEFMPGSPIETLGHAVVDRLLELHITRLGIARADDPSHWPMKLITTLTSGGEGYCLHESLRTYDERTAALLVRIARFGSTIEPGDLVGRDIVHWDMHPGNLLQEKGALSAIIDNDFALVGDAAFDLVQMALSSLALPCESGVRSRLFSVAFDELDNLSRQAYLGHLFIRFLDWPIRRGRGDEVDFWLEQADRMLDL